MTREEILNKAQILAEKAEHVGEKMPKSSIIAATIDMAEWVLNSLWKPADGEDLPEYDREVIALEGIVDPTATDSFCGYKVVFAHRPDSKGWDTKNLLTGKVEHYTPKTYDKGGWNIPYVKFWLDLDLPKI